MINGINISGLSEFTHEVKDDSGEALLCTGVKLDWQNGTRMNVATRSMYLGPHRVIRDFGFAIDEPRQLLGLNSAPNPQEYLLGALAGCMAVVYTIGASLLEVHLESLQIQIDGKLDLRGMMGLADDVPVQLQDVSYVIRVQGDGTGEQYEALHERVKRYSPNYNAFINPINLKSGTVETNHTKPLAEAV